MAHDPPHGDEPIAPTQRDPTLRAAGSHAGPYRLEREIGSGAAGKVYRAVDDRTGAVVALKLVGEASWRARFIREIETLSRLSHPGIVRYVAHGETPNGTYLAMEWLDGEDLGSALARGPLPWPAARALALRVTDALAHAHGIGAVHRDLSTRNVFLPGGRVDEAKILDFGLVRVDDAVGQTKSHAVLGTPFYTAPEQVRNAKDVDSRADLFSLGVILFEALSGARPFEADDLFTVWFKIVQQPTPDLRPLAPGVPERFVRLVEALLAKDPAARPRSAVEVQRALLELDGEVSALAPTVPTMAPLHAPSGALPGPSVSTPATASARTALLADRAVPPRAASSGRTWLIVGVVAAFALALVAATLVGARVNLRGRADRAARRSVEEAPTSAPTPSIAPGPPASTVTPSSSTFFCGSDDVVSQKGQTYVGGREAFGQAAVFVGGECKATLEDCVVKGAEAISVLGNGQLTLRRCRVSGEIRLNGPVTLILEQTTLPTPPKTLGGARVIRR